MNSFPKLLISLFLSITILSIPISATRDLQLKPNPNPRRQSLESRLQLTDGLSDCWTSLIELKSCTNEIILFFLNGESYLTMDCCHAIRTITHRCWPSMLSTVGFTVEEADILRGYCDAELAPPAPTMGSLSPIQSPAPATVPT
ncbi:hypothetical protein LUZ60_007498 [Juncus effusus]|nr:hypothetical protein LUZ60_007498 [Juncus effusus]